MLVLLFMQESLSSPCLGANSKEINTSWIKTGLQEGARSEENSHGNCIYELIAPARYLGAPFGDPDIPKPESK